MVLSKVNAACPEPGSRSTCLFKLGTVAHTGCIALSSKTTGLGVWELCPLPAGTQESHKGEVLAHSHKAKGLAEYAPPWSLACSAHGGARGLLPVQGRHLQPHTPEHGEAGAVQTARDPLSQDYRVRGLWADVPGSSKACTGATETYSESIISAKPGLLSNFQRKTLKEEGVALDRTVNGEPLKGFWEQSFLIHGDRITPEKQRQGSKSCLTSFHLGTCPNSGRLTE